MQCGRLASIVAYVFPTSNSTQFPAMIAQGVKKIPSILLRRRSSRILQADQAKKLDCDGQIDSETKRVCDDLADSAKSNTKRVKSESFSTKVESDGSDTRQQTSHEAANNIDLNNYDGLLEIDTVELNLERTLLGGQSFRWTKSTCFHEDKPIELFTGVVKNLVLRLWRLNANQIAYFLLNKDRVDAPKLNGSFFTDYFQLKYNLKDLYGTWSSKDKHLEQCCKDYEGFRILRQDPVENVFSFICATNNNIKRISQMVEKLCRKFGPNLTDSYHMFPEIERLAGQDVEDCLRNELGFGYRAKYIAGTAKKLLELSEKEGVPADKYLLSLRELPYKETCKQLMQLPGIGRKVADCICLMSMDHLNAVPTDCHIYDIVCRNYIPELKNRKANLNEAVHDQIGDHFNDLHGSLAGWSTSVLFIGELKHLKLEAAASKSTTSKKPSKKEKKNS